MREKMVDLELTRQAASKRVPEAGAPIPAVVGDEGEEEEREVAFASDDDQLSQVLDAARLYASGDDEELAGVLLAFLENRVEGSGAAPASGNPQHIQSSPGRDKAHFIVFIGPRAHLSEMGDRLIRQVRSLTIPAEFDTMD
jgi:hypothetical protein